jgi:hypothetical protein
MPPRLVLNLVGASIGRIRGGLIGQQFIEAAIGVVEV